MLEQSVKLSRPIIFYFINNFLIYAPILPNRSQKPVLFAVFSFLERFFSSSTVVSVAKANVLQTPTIAVFARNWSGADPNFAPFRWRIWLALSEFLCLLTNQNVTFVTLFCTKLPFFCTQLPFFCSVLPKNCLSLSQSQWRNFFMYIIKYGTTLHFTEYWQRPERQRLSRSSRAIILDNSWAKKANLWCMLNCNLFSITL